MVGILFSLCIAIFLFFNPLSPEALPNPIFIGTVLIVIASLFLLVQTLLTGLAWTPLQKNEENLLSRSIEMYSNDRNLKFTNTLLLAFLLLTFIVTIEIVYFNHINQIYLLAGWTIALGIAVDLLHHFFHRLQQYLNPYKVIDFFVEEGNLSIRQDHERDLTHWIDALSETGIKAVEKNSPSLANHAIDRLEHLIRNFLRSSKSFVHSELDEQSREMGVQDRVSYTLFYLFEHLDLIHNKSLEKEWETVSNKIIGVMGKTLFHTAQYDISYAAYPIHYLGKFAKKAQTGPFPEVGNRAMLTLLEVSKQIAKEIDTQYLNLQGPFLSIITHMTEIAKESFRQNREMDLKLLTGPFRELKELFQKEPLKDHQDASVILASIENVIDEFETLENILKTMPPFSAPSSEDEKQED